MGKVPFNVTWEKGTPSIAQICSKFGFEAQELDQHFGVVEIDPEDNLYTILVDQKAAERVREQLGEDTPDIEGPFSDVRIEPFGPPSESG
jgi:hypothetical protein